MNLKAMFDRHDCEFTEEGKYRKLICKGCGKIIMVRE